ncbi:ribosome biogenesis GTPase YlqF [Caldalkalibacillus salinus]|uniref:ribosome biogenesis GTPase YlqF n=1 Tax=Caldalkalibacillus salinus TaxID=2803787 RepID=UPI00192440A2|nr:ribosome biogenesis GTPase YlqF [Caldalkalibacillus salinus]
MSIQWFPGHMAKARRQVSEKLKLIDVVIELLDARLPYSSHNPMMSDIIAQKPRVVLLNKADLADPERTDEWVQYFREEEGVNALPVDAQSGAGIKKIPAACQSLVQDIQEKRKAKGMKPRSVRALIVGIPNVGKSSLINRLANRHIAKTGDRPGITTAQQWIKVGKEMELLDTPGILWPKFEDQAVGFRLAASGAIKDDILDIEEIAFHTVGFLREHYPERLMARYDLESIPDDSVTVLDMIGEKRGALMRGGIINYEKVSELLLRELRSGKLGRMTFETPNMTYSNRE